MGQTMAQTENGAKVSADLDGMTLFAGNANPGLAQDIARHLAAPLGRASVGRFSDGEVNIEIMFATTFAVMAMRVARGRRSWRAYPK